MSGCLWDFEEGGLRFEAHDYSGDGGTCVNCYSYAPSSPDSGTTT